MPDPIARDSVRVNARHNVNAAHAAACHNCAMDSEWFTRLVVAIEDDRRSYNEISREAGLGRNFVQQMVKYGKMPTGPKLEAILKVLGGEKALYILTGLEVRPGDMEILRLIQQSPPSVRENVAGLLRAARGGQPSRRNTDPAATE